MRTVMSVLAIALLTMLIVPALGDNGRPDGDEFHIRGGGGMPLPPVGDEFLIRDGMPLRRDDLRLRYSVGPFPGQPGPGDRSPDHGFLGVVPAPVPPPLAAQLGIDDGRGVLVVAVAPDSPAAKAGIAVHDVITQIDEQIIYAVEQLHKLIAARRPEATVRVMLIRKGERLTREVTLARAEPPGPGRPGPMAPPRPLLPGPPRPPVRVPDAPDRPARPDDPPADDLSRALESLRDRLPRELFEQLRKAVEQARRLAAEEAERARRLLDERRERLQRDRDDVRPPDRPGAPRRPLGDDIERLMDELREMIRRSEGMLRDRPDRPEPRREGDPRPDVRREGEPRPDRPEPRREGDPRPDRPEPRREGDPRPDRPDPRREGEPRPDRPDVRREGEGRDSERPAVQRQAQVMVAPGRAAARAVVSAESQRYRAVWEHRADGPPRVSLFDKQADKPILRDATPDELARLMRELDDEARDLLRLIHPAGPVGPVRPRQ